MHETRQDKPRIRWRPILAALAIAAPLWMGLLALASMLRHLGLLGALLLSAIAA
jgi:hypothetical protein